MRLPICAFALLFSQVVRALVVVLPHGGTVWQQTGVNIIEWGLYPLTYPTPTSQYFDIWLRNGVGALYTPSLNVSIASSVDAVGGFSVALELSDQFLAGDGYEIFLTEAGNANNYYCQSSTFGISGVGDTIESVTTAPNTVMVTYGITQPASSVTTSSYTGPSPGSTITLPKSASTAAASLHQAPNPGGQDDEGFGLLSGAEGRRMDGVWKVVLGWLLGAGALWVL